MAAWDDILRATLEAAGKGADEIEKIIAKIVKQVDTPAAKSVVARTEELSAAELAKMSKAERAAYNASKNTAAKASAEAGQKLSRAETKLANVKETEDIVNKTMTESMKNKFGQAGLTTQINKMYGAGFDVSENAILKRVEAEVYKAVSEAKDAGSPLSRDQVKELISTKTKEVTEQMTKAAEGSKKATETRINNIKELTPEEARMSGVKTALITQAAKAEKVGDAESLLSRLTKLAKDENLLPVLDAEGKQVTFEVVVDGKKIDLPRYETRAERSLRITKEKEFKAKDVSEPNSKPTAPAKTQEELLNIKAQNDSVVTESSAKLRAQQEANVLKGAKEGAEKSVTSSAERLSRLEKNYGRVFDNPAKVEGDAAKNALDNINKRYNKGLITKEQYLELLQGVPKITGRAVTDADMAAIEKKIAENAARRQAEKAAEEAAAAAKAKQPVPATELKGRKWIRDARGNLVLAKK